MRGEIFDVESWQTDWYEERLQHPAGLRIQAEESLRKGDTVAIRAFSEHPFENSSAAPGWSLWLIHETLTAYTAARLATTLSIVSRLHALDLRESLGFLVHRYLYSNDLVRAFLKQPSLLFEAPWTEFDDWAEALDGSFQLPSGRFAKPLWRLEELFTKWELLDQPLPSDMLNTPLEPGERVSYLWIPPLRMSFQDIQRFSDKPNQALKIAMLADPIVQPFIEPLTTILHTCARAGVPLQFNVGHQMDADQRDPIHTPAEGQPNFDPLSDDQRAIRFHGQTFYATSRQADIIKNMLRAHQQGKPAMTEHYLLGQLESLNGRLRDSFRSNLALFKTLILRPRPGYYQLHPDYLKQCGIHVKE